MDTFWGREKKQRECSDGARGYTSSNPFFIVIPLVFFPTKFLLFPLQLYPEICQKFACRAFVGHDITLRGTVPVAPFERTVERELDLMALALKLDFSHGLWRTAAETHLRIWRSGHDFPLVPITTVMATPDQDDLSRLCHRAARSVPCHKINHESMRVATHLETEIFLGKLKGCT